ncbi:MAG: hypothetical protein CFE22_14575 [Cytophagaceae bacterium BCCC1]|nr:MAG: hypothetical protein CFE22_14575 [Cytophagaceae bacterium BCCC1]
MREKLNRNHDVRIVYYLGAGASANAIPMVGEIGKAILKFNLFIQTETIQSTSSYSNLTEDLKKQCYEFRDFCLKYTSLIENVASIDTYAKRLWDQDSMKDYEEYKLFLVVLFNFFHFLETKKELTNTTQNTLEGRYENLIRTINTGRGKTLLIPYQFSFLSWNYDFQLEATMYRDFENQSSILDSSRLKENLFRKIVNFNGSSNLDDIIEFPESRGHSEVFKKLFEIYQKVKKDKVKNKLKFAWEQSLDLFTFSDFRETRFVVVIGYSFPSFNRDIDKAFFSLLKTDLEIENKYGSEGENKKTKVFTQGYDFADSIRIKRYLEQIFDGNKAPFEIIPVESPFFYVPAEYWK